MPLCSLQHNSVGLICSNESKGFGKHDFEIKLIKRRLINSRFGRPGDLINVNASICKLVRK